MTALAGMMVSVLAVMATVAIAWINQKTFQRRELLREEVRKRETLYGEFIGECARLLMDAFQRTLDQPETLLPAYALLNRIRLCATPEVLAAAERLVARIMDQYFSSNLSLHELRVLARSSEADPLKEFGEACVVELKSMLGKIPRPHSRLRPASPSRALTDSPPNPDASLTNRQQVSRTLAADRSTDASLR
jgi:hypothetical protein